MADTIDYTKIPVSVSNQKALWKKVNDTFAGAAATDEEFLAYISDTSVVGDMYIMPPAKNDEFIEYMFDRTQGQH